MRIATWNINSVRLRISLVRRFARQASPDVLCLQETKVEDDLFPTEACHAMGFPHLAYFGQKGYHGVAILSRLPIERYERHERGGNREARHVSVVLVNGIEIHNLYVPAGGDEPDVKSNPKFAEKLEFFDEITAWFAERQEPKHGAVLVGDLNVAPLENDVWSHKQLLGLVSHTPIEVTKLATLQKSWRWVDSVRRFV
ncbi:MAG: exodeoxyribonuclease III, partial [Alphaproteobacteria bacterium]|nr:exodeoxyribonuclease III [Alphaproteobacteria bacterium]